MALTVTANRSAIEVPRWALRALAVATTWLVLLGTLVPIVIPSLGAWLPSHEHRTLTAFVPPHSHVYERASNAPVGAACGVTPHAHTSAQDAHVVCTTGDDLASGALAVVMPGAPVALPGSPGTSVATRLEATASPINPTAPVLTPPPRH